MKKYIVMFLFTIAAQPLTAAVYKWTDKDGGVHYGEQPPVLEQAQMMHLKDSSSADQAAAGEPKRKEPNATADEPAPRKGGETTPKTEAPKGAKE